jgi:hypothetical protein
METILHLCADIGSDSAVWEDHGYNVIKVGRDVGVENFHYDGEVFGIIANPVCTEFSIATGFDKVGDHTKGMFLVNHCLRIINECQPTGFHYIENPATGHLKDFLCKPDYTYQPWWFGSPWTKRTALWGRFKTPERLFYKWDDVTSNPHLYIRPGRKIPGLVNFHKSSTKHIPEFARFADQINDDMSLRSMCSQGFVKQFYKENKYESIMCNASM